MSHFGAVLDGLAQHLDRHGRGVYNVDGVFAADERGIVISAFPAAPREIVALTLYSPEYTRTSPTATRQMTACRVQIKYRLHGQPLAVVEFFEGLKDLLDGKHLPLGDVTAHSEFQSYTPLGQNNADTWVASTNWRLSSLRAL